MSIKKILKTVAATALSAAIVAAMSVTSFATTGVVTPESNKITLTNVLTNANTDAYTPNTSFTFTVTPVTVAAGTTATSQNDSSKSIPVYSGVEGGAKFDGTANTISYTETDTNLTKTTQITLDPSVFAGEVKPGVYRYQVTESTPTTAVQGMDYDSTTYYLDLYVENDAEDGSTKKISAVVVSKDGTVTGKSDLSFAETYTTTDLTVGKTVAGNQGDKSASWAFTIVVTPDSGASVGKLKTSSGDALELKDGVYTATANLKTGETFSIYGLSEGDQYTVTETGANGDGYVTTYEKKVGTTTSVAAGAAYPTGGIAGTEGSFDNSVQVTNRKEVTTPTGVILTYAPYILLVAGAAVFAVIFFRRRRNGED